MKILIVSPCYPPDLGPSAPMLRMLAESLVASGNQVTVLAAVPHFPTGQVPPHYRRRLWTWEYSNAVRIGRAWMPSGNRANLIHRSLTFLVYQVLVALVGLGLEYDVAFIANPAIETGLPFLLLGWMRRKPVVFGVWDVYPEVGVRMGLFRNRTVIRLVSILEDFCLHTARRIQVLGEGFLADLAHHKVKPENIVVIPPWLDTEQVHPMPRQNSFSCEYGLNDRFVVLYAGNLGLSQGLNNVLEAARTLEHDSEILFLFVGDGASKEQLISQGAALNNVRFLPFQPRERLSEVLATADVSLVVLKSGIGYNSLPSKTFSILSSGRPVLACVDEGTDTWNFIERSRSGLCVYPESPAALAQAIHTLKDDPERRKQMGSNGRTWVERYHSLKAVADQFDTLLMSAIEDR
jgi:colanic acid biosynthesis glycosyl transferase WcaI